MLRANLEHLSPTEQQAITEFVQLPPGGLFVFRKGVLPDRRLLDEKQTLKFGQTPLESVKKP